MRTLLMLLADACQIVIFAVTAYQIVISLAGFRKKPASGRTHEPNRFRDSNRRSFQFAA